LDLRDGSGNIYSNLLGQINYSQLDFNTRQGRKDIKAGLRGVYDGTYETTAFKKRGIFRIGDDINVHFGFNAAVGVSRKINKRFNISLEHELISSDNDYLDGIHWRTDVDQTNNNDIGHYTNLRLGINLGNFKKKVEPLYWINPLDAVFSDIAELKQRPKFDLNDSDQDGVIDLLDQEQETPAGAPVDTRGITLDSDNDGQADYKDEEPYSAPGYPVNEKGIAQIPVQPKLTEEDVKKLIEQKVATMPYGNVNGQSGTYPGGTYPAGSTGGSTGGNTGGSTGGTGGGYNAPGGVYSAGSVDWFLPMIHFNLDAYCVKSQFAGQLHQVAQVMQMHPNLMVTAYGHTDAKNTNNYNQVLSYNRAKAAIEYLVTKYNIPRERFKLMYGGEESPLGANHYINRRVEFRVSRAEDNDMARPEGPEAGDGCGKKKMKRAGSVKTDDGTDKDKKTGY
jgi:outer membrane protein OmpA-like peptidoglycan-associated protein